MLSLILSALCIFYAFAFSGGSLSDAFNFTTKKTDYDAIGADALYYFVQGSSTTASFNNVIVILGIILLLFMVTLFITASNKRRNYYVTNYVSIIAAVAFAVFYAVFMIIQLSYGLSLYNQINFEEFKSLAEMLSVPYSKSYVIFILGYILSVVVLIDAAALVYNLIWKIKLMQGEKKLLENGLVKEVA